MSTNHPDARRPNDPHSSETPMYPKLFFMLFALSLVCSSCTRALPVCDQAPEYKPPSYDYYRIDFAAESRILNGDQTAEINQTPAYSRLIGNVQTVAIRAPNECLDTTAAKAEGRTSESEMILKSTCGIYLKEIERELTSVGYRVISWDVLDREEKTSSVSTYKAADRLGADAVFIVNSIETLIEQPDDKRTFRFRYFFSNEEGDMLEPLSLTDSEQRKYAKLVFKRIPDALDQGEKLQVLVASLDTTAVAVPSGESIWFYRRSLREFTDEEAAADIYRKFLFATNGERFWAVWPEGAERPSTSKGISRRSSSSEFSLTRSNEESLENQYRNRQQKMVRTIVKEFATKFESGASQ